MRRTQVVAAAAAVLIGGGAGIATFGDGRGGDDRTGAARAESSFSSARVDEAGASVAGAGAIADAAAVGAPSGVPVAEPRVVKTAQLELSVSSNALVTRATQRVNRIAESHGGFIASTDATGGEHRQTTFSLRVPVDRYDAALSELRRLGKVTAETISGRDVTNTLVDLEARLRTLRAQEAALNALVARARTVGETLEVAREASNVRMQIEQLAAQQAQLADQAAFATISLHVVGPGVPVEKPEPEPQPLLLDSAERALGATLAVFGGTIILLGYLLPSALLAAIGYGLWRVVRGRRPQSAAVAS